MKLSPDQIKIIADNIMAKGIIDDPDDAILAVECYFGFTLPDPLDRAIAKLRLSLRGLQKALRG